MKIPIVLDDETRPVWEAAQKAKAEVDAWPEWKKGNAGPVGAQKDPDSDEWTTPKWLADALGPYDLDPCSNSRSHIRAHHKAGKEWGQDGLTWAWWQQDQHKRIFINPPYSDVMPWAERAVWAAERGAAVDMLLKLDPTTKWFARLMGSDVFAYVWALKKRVKFERPGKAPLTANFPSVLVCLNSPLPEALRDHVWGFGTNGNCYHVGGIE